MAVLSGEFSQRVIQAGVLSTQDLYCSIIIFNIIYNQALLENKINYFTKIMKCFLTCLLIRSQNNQLNIDSLAANIFGNEPVGIIFTMYIWYKIYPVCRCPVLNS